MACAATYYSALSLPGSPAMAEVASEVAVTRVFSTRSEQNLDRLCVGIFTLAGRHLVDVEMDGADTVLDLKREIRLSTGYLHFKMVCGAAILSEDDSLEKAGLCENPTVQLVVLANERFVTEWENSVAGLYLLHDGTAEAFSCTTRIVNRQEDEEHFQRTLWGHWSIEGDIVSVVFDDFERNVFNEAAMAGWTSRPGRKPLPTQCELKLRREEDGARILHIGSLAGIPGGQAQFWFPETLDRLPPGEVCMFDAWHLAGTSTVP